MNKKKALFQRIIIIILLILSDFVVALTLNKSPFIKRRYNINKNNLLYIDRGLFTNTYKCQNKRLKTYLRSVKYKCPYEENMSNIITIIFDARGGSKVDSITLKKGEKLILPKDPVYEGHTFKGWVDKNEKPIYNEALLNEDTTLFAIYEKKSDIDSKEPVKEEKPINKNKPLKEIKNKEESKKSPDKKIEEKPSPRVKTLAEVNNEYRQNIQNKYGVRIVYKDELGSYVVKGYRSSRLYDDNVINKCLKEIDKGLAKYPNGFFREAKNNNMPLTIYLVGSLNTVAGLTDAHDKHNMKVILPPALLFEHVMHHEIMHYIDSYIKVKAYPIDLNSTMKELNPSDFNYGDKSNKYVYFFTDVNNAYFLSSYGKTNYLEDRAVIFAELMFRTYTRDCYAEGKPLNKKARLISKQIKEHFKILNPNGKYYWDRFIY